MAINNSVNASQTGMQSQTSTGVWNGRTLTAGAGISIADGDGVAGNPTISASVFPGASWQFIETKAFSSNEAIFNTSINSYTELCFISTNANVSVLMSIQVSADNGSTLINMVQGGTTATTKTVSAAGASFLVRVENFTGTAPKYVLGDNEQAPNSGLNAGVVSSAQLNWIRLFSGNTLTGDVNVYGR
ncbi:MAG: hypothetical protein WC089_03850 [Candidatus Paceibacterota bacterium]